MVPPALASLPALGVARHAWLEVLGKPNQRQNGGGLTGRHRATCFPARPVLPAGAGQAGHMCPSTAKVPCPCAKLYPNKSVAEGHICISDPHLAIQTFSKATGTALVTPGLHPTLPCQHFPLTYDGTYLPFSLPMMPPPDTADH